MKFKNEDESWGPLSYSAFSSARETDVLWDRLILDLGKAWLW